MNLIKKFKWLEALCTFVFFCVCSLLTISTSLSAHILNETTAQVILRDGQIEVKIYTDLEQLISTLQSNQAWLMGDINAVMPENLNVSQQEAFVVQALKKSMSLTVNGKLINFDNVALKSDSVDNKINLDKGYAHGRQIVFHAKHSFSHVSDLSISFHKSLGAIHTSFIKPQYKLLNAGDTAHILF